MENVDFKVFIEKIFQDYAEFTRGDTKLGAKGSVGAFPVAAAAASSSSATAVASSSASFAAPATPMKLTKLGTPIRCRQCGVLGQHHAEQCPQATPEQREAHAKVYADFKAAERARYSSPAAATAASAAPPPAQAVTRS
jgi:Spy/CpxP family protein refolding chaperone